MSNYDTSLDQFSGKNASVFTRLSQATARWAGKPQTFFVAMSLIILWGLSGPIFGFNDTWQLVINTSTTIITFLMVFIIQNSQNRDTCAMQIKLDELIVRLEGAREELLDLEEMDEEQLEKLRNEFEKRAAIARGETPGGGDDQFVSSRKGLGKVSATARRTPEQTPDHILLTKRHGPNSVHS